MKLHTMRVNGIVFVVMLSALLPPRCPAEDLQETENPQKVYNALQDAKKRLDEQQRRRETLIQECKRLKEQIANYKYVIKRNNDVLIRLRQEARGE